ncbi:MAG: 1-acyl-sn-glycerol-3-phosphate acyltransferase [Bacteroidales bacterium]
MNENSEIRVAGKKFIDIEEVFTGKSPRMSRLIPGFVFRYLKRIIHQDELNDALERYKDKMGLDFIDHILDEFGAKIIVEGINNMPAEGRYIVAANHPLGGLDGMVLMKVVGKVRPDILFPVNDLLMYLPNLKPLFIPINKHGRNTENLRIFDDAFASDSVILYFPAGLCSRKIKGKIEDLEWKKTFISKARKFERDIIPVYVEGKNSNFFYNLANWRVRLGIKQNIEMLYLVDEMVKQKNKEIILRFGKPVSYTLFKDPRKDKESTQMIRQMVYSLAKSNNN